jgi:hypothetical protein
MRRKLGAALFVVGFALAAVYAVGGSAAFSRVRARIRAFMEPPTPIQMEQAVAASQQQSAIDSAQRDTVGGHQAAPASLGAMLVMMGIALGGVFLLLVLSARWPTTKPPS